MKFTRKFTGLLLTAVLLLGLFGALPAAAAGTLEVKASVTSVVVGNSVKLTLTYSGGNVPIASIDAGLKYNNAAFEYVSCTGGNAYGGAGVLKLSWFADAVNAPTSTSFVLVFKAIAAGNGDFEVSTAEFISDTDATSLGTPEKQISITATNPTLSGNADLKSLKVSSGTLTPAFKAATTQYTVEVPYTVTSLNLSATAAQSGAKVAVGGGSKLSVGKNTKTVTVTAPNGKTKTYTVVITRAANQATGTTAGGGTTATTAPTADPLEVTVDGVEMTVADTQTGIDLPAGYVWSTVTINGIAVSAAVGQTDRTTLVYLVNPADQTGAFYVYTATDGQFVRFRPMTVAGGLYVLFDAPSGMQAPVGTAEADVTVGEVTVRGWTYEDSAQAGFAVLYATAPDGRTGLYVYDSTDGSMQRYREVTVKEEVPIHAEPIPEYPNRFVEFLREYRDELLLGIAAVAALALLIGVIALTVHAARKKKKNSCKH